MRLARLKKDIDITTADGTVFQVLQRGAALTFKGTRGNNAILVNPRNGRIFETAMANVDLMEERRG